MSCVLREDEGGRRRGRVGITHTELHKVISGTAGTKLLSSDIFLFTRGTGHTPILIHHRMVLRRRMLRTDPESGTALQRILKPRLLVL